MASHLALLRNDELEDFKSHHGINRLYRLIHAIAMLHGTGDFIIGMFAHLSWPH
jgi:hypothetical protein